MMQFRHVQDAFTSDDCGGLKSGNSTPVGNVRALQKAAIGYH